jgi:hypothetical protein
MPRLAALLSPDDSALLGRLVDEVRDHGSDVPARPPIVPVQKCVSDPEELVICRLGSFLAPNRPRLFRPQQTIHFEKDFQQPSVVVENMASVFH